MLQAGQKFRAFPVLIGLLVLLSVSQMGLAQILPTFRIGILDDPFGALGQGAALAMQEINAAGGVQGADGSIFQLEPVFIPPDADGSIDAALDNLAQANVIAVLGPMSSDATLNNLGRLQDLRIPVLTPAVGDTIIASDSSGLIFRSRAAEFLQGRALATYIREDLRFASVVTVQLDIASTASVIGFSSAASALGIPPQQNLLFSDNVTLEDLARQVVALTPQVVAAYGTPELTADLYIQLRSRGWSGVFATPQAANPVFRARIPLEELTGMIGTTTWSAASTDAASQAFVLDYVRATGEAPDAVAAAGYDSIRMIARAIGQPGTLEANLAQLEDLHGVQGLLRPGQLSRGETSDNVAVIRLGALGGPQVVARFAGGVRQELEGTETGGGGVVGNPPTATPSPEPTLDGVYVRIVSQVQNVRSGPGTNYDVLGQLQQGELRRVLGANVQFTWVVIDFRGLQGWLSTDPALLEVLGDRSTVPVVAAPPTPTPPPATGTPGAGSDPNFPDIVVVAASPTELQVNASVLVNVTVRNAGGVNAGPFAVAASFPPNEFFAAQNLSGLAAGAEQTFQLQVNTPSQTGNFEAVIVADLNQEVNEGPSGEANNGSFLFRYRIDRPSLPNVATLALGSALDLDFNGIPDINFNAGGINTNAGCTGAAYCIGVLSPGLTWQTAHYDAITSAAGVNTTAVLNQALTSGTTLGVLTDSGKRVVIRIDAITPGSSVQLTYRTY